MTDFVQSSVQLYCCKDGLGSFFAVNHVCYKFSGQHLVSVKKNQKKRREHNSKETKGN